MLGIKYFGANFFGRAYFGGKISLGTIRVNTFYISNTLEDTFIPSNRVSPIFVISANDSSFISNTVDTSIFI